MNIKSKGINKGETFLCEKKHIRNIFKNESITIFLGHRKNISDGQKKDIIAELVFYRYNVKFMNFPSYFLYIYPVQENHNTEELREEFQLFVLPKLYELYIQKKDCFLAGKEFGSFKIQVELKNNIFYFYD